MGGVEGLRRLFQKTSKLQAMVEEIIAILKEGTEEECRRMKKFFEENPDQIQVKNGDRSSMTFKFLVCPKALLDEV